MKKGCALDVRILTGFNFVSQFESTQWINVLPPFSIERAQGRSPRTPWRRPTTGPDWRWCAGIGGSALPVVEVQCRPLNAEMVVASLHGPTRPRCATPTMSTIRPRSLCPCLSLLSSALRATSSGSSRCCLGPVEC